MGQKVKSLKPHILFEGNYTTKDVEELRTAHVILCELDIVEEQLHELFKINHPHLLYSPNFSREQKAYIDRIMKVPKLTFGNWIYLPWIGTLIHTVNESDYFKLRTNRNRELVSYDEQLSLNKLSVGVVGLSIGSSIAISLAYEGVSNTVKLAEHDRLETTNLNRVRAGIQHITLNKSEFALQKIYEINPYACITLFEEGVHTHNIADFLEGLDIVIDEIDDFEMKVLLRVESKKRKIPVMMITNVHDTIIVDIERYDTDDSLELFNGVLGPIPMEILDKRILSESEKHEYAVKFVGREHISPKALHSVMNIGKTIVGRPQLNSIVTTGAGIASYFIRTLFLTNSIQSGRYIFPLQESIKKI